MESIIDEVDRVLNHRKREGVTLQNLAKKINKVPKSITIPTEYMA